MEDTPRRRPDRQARFDLASEQYGYFTADQASRCGYAPNLLTYHAKRGSFQRLLARLLMISPDRWILKGGLALGFRLSHRGARPRATKDMDLARRGELATADADFQRVQDIDLGDHFELIVPRVELATDSRTRRARALRIWSTSYCL